VTTKKQQLQETLFPEADADPLNPHADESRLPARRGPGRPPGALNRATKELREFILTNFTDPVIGAARVMMMRPQDLATALGCTLLEAYDRIDRARQFVARYTHQEMPKAVEIGGTGSVTLVIGAVDSGGQAQLGAPGDGAVVIEGTLAPTQQDQALSAAKPGELDNSELDK
jgi:hypothetical protein